MMGHLALNSSCLNDDTLGPGVIGCRDDFDFTITFEQIFLSILPNTTFIALAGLRLAQLTGTPRLVDGRAIQLLKLVQWLTVLTCSMCTNRVELQATVTVYVALQIALCVCVGSIESPGNVLILTAMGFGLVAATFFYPLSFREHSHSHRPSTLFNAYLLTSLLFDAIITRTNWLEDGSSSAVRTMISSIVVKTLILILESQGKERWLTTPCSLSPEETAGVFSLALFTWLNNLVARGYRYILSPQDLPRLDPSVTAQTHAASFRKLWQNVSPGRHKLFRALVWKLRWYLLAPIAPRISFSAFLFAQPFIINKLLQYLQDSDSLPRSIAYGFIIMIALAYTGESVSNGVYHYVHTRAGTVLRACLVTAIYETTAEGAQSHAKDNLAAVTLMSTEVDRITDGFEFIHESWSNIIQVGIACWLLQRELGTAFIAPLVTVVLCAGVSFILGQFSSARIGTWMGRVQKRVALTADTMANMTSVKMLGLQEAMAEKIQNSRRRELMASRHFRLITTVAAVNAFAPLMLSPAITFALTGERLTVPRVFTALAYLQLLSGPLAGLFQTIPMMQTGFVCLRRVQEYLERTTENTSGKTGTMWTGNASVEPEIQLAQDGELGWQDDKIILRNLNICVPRSRLTMVTGPVASGKSTFCMGILGELPYISGRMLSPNNFTRVAFCAQTPFIYNATVRENITGNTEFDNSWYTAVIQATGLDEDLASLPEGDESRVGSNGIILSGGQKQRVSLARALYSRPQFAIFDDVLSGLDPATESHVFDNVLGPEGLLSQLGTTTILCTHSIAHLDKADYIVVLDGGSTLKAGVPQDIMADKAVVSKIVSKPSGPKEGSNSPVGPSDFKPDPSNSAQRESAQEQEKKARQIGDLRIYSYYFSQAGPPQVVYTLLAFLLIVVTIFGFLFNVGPVWLKFWAASVARGEDRFVFYASIYALMQVIGLIFAGLFWGGNSVVLGPSIGGRIHQKALMAVMAAPLWYFTSTDLGTLTSYFSQDMSILDTDLSMGLGNTVATTMAVLGKGAIIAASSPLVIFGYPALIGMLYFVQRVYLRTSRQLRLLELEAKGPL